MAKRLNRVTNAEVLRALNLSIDVRFGKKAEQTGKLGATNCQLCRVADRQQEFLSKEGTYIPACSSCPIRIYTGKCCTEGKFGEYLEARYTGKAGPAIRAVREELEAIRVHFFGKDHAELLKK